MLLPSSSVWAAACGTRRAARGRHSSAGSRQASGRQLGDSGREDGRRHPRRHGETFMAGPQRRKGGHPASGIRHPASGIRPDHSVKADTLRACCQLYGAIVVFVCISYPSPLRHPGHGTGQVSRGLSCPRPGVGPYVAHAQPSSLPGNSKSTSNPNSG